MHIESTTDGKTSVRNTSQLTGQTHIMIFDIPVGIFLLNIRRWQEGMYIQDAFRECNEDQREFLMTGITPEEWNAHMGDDDE